MTADQSRPVSRVSVVEALTQIRTLCDKLARENAYAEDGVFAGVMHTVSRVRAVLDAVSVDATPAQGIDREALLAAIRECAPAGMELRYDGTEDKYAAAYVAGVQAAHDAADRILALMRPVEGVVLSREEVVTVRFALDYTRNRAVLGGRDQAHMKALASRLEVS